MTVDSAPIREAVIVGAGIAGIGMAARLRRAGIRDFLVLERAERIGGTWRDNVYPGVACDIPSHLYEYSFRPKPDWTRRFAPGAELLEYLDATVVAEGVDAHLRLGTALERAEWLEERGCWLLRTSTGTVRSRALVMAAGRLSEPRMPDVAGLDGFAGPVAHSANWTAPELEGRSVGVVGTGASAVQLVPELAGRAARLIVFQRTPAWVLPREDAAYAPSEPRPSRRELAAQAEGLFAARLRGSPEGAALARRAREHLRRQVADEELRRRLAPTAEIGCKRAVFSDRFYPALARDDVTLEASALAGIADDGRTALAASGAQYRLDALILATGFETVRPPFARLIRARRRSLDEHWRDGMTSYASVVVSGFPNLFVLDGPNAALGHHSAFEVIEAQIDYVLGALDHLRRHGGALEVSPEAEAAYTARIERMAARTVWAAGCGNRYVDPRSGRLTVIWPERASRFRALNGRFDPAPFLGAAARR
ncbi:flavin-containing monooxygenase [Agromyces mediolanus]|uniref:Monooxygenase n=1 Tax=Agromyces mediolanus TaxID=41986 RepID=A0A918FHB9_AGRME|nr:NAD(P)/FAD-dependent oxidoreductase [Agromyces mediolanus]GGR37683.1 monooxygenase [Agromyces mediolanus]GLJ72943.1 monooxygenase [Agromyces mediolanus]